ncbi:hypothetical protein YC2023_117163 [Brassica napus]
MGKHGENGTVRRKDFLGLLFLTSLGERVVSNLCFDLHLIYFGTACPVIHAWLLNIYFIVFVGNELPKFMR